MTLAEDIDKKWGDQALFSVVDDVMQIAENRAKFEFAPRGATNSLRDGILRSKAIRQGGNVIAVILSEAKNKGFDYAEKQHDVPLRHASPDGKQDFSFADFGHSGSTFEQYWQGFYKLIKENRFFKYPTKYLDQALTSVEKLLDRELAAL